LVATQGGVASGTVVSGPAGLAYAQSGGVLSASVLSADGGVELKSGGLAADSQISSGGFVIVSAGAVAKADAISAGGLEIAQSGGVVSAATLSGGTLTVSSGARLAGGLVIDAGSAVIAGGAAAGQTISFGGSSGDLVLDNLAAFSATIAGLATPGQTIDLAGFAYGSGETASWSEAASHASGTLTITDGAKVAKLSLVGNYVTSNFTLSTDGAGGTFVVDPPLASPTHTVARFVQAASVLGAGSSLAHASFSLTSGGAAANDFTSAVIPTAASSFGGG